MERDRKGSAMRWGLRTTKAGVMVVGAQYLYHALTEAVIILGNALLSLSGTLSDTCKTNFTISRDPF